MRVLFFLEEFPSLSETFILAQITGVLDRGQDVQIFAGSRGDEALVHPDVERYGLLGRTSYPIRLGGRGAIGRLSGVSEAWRRLGPAATARTLDVLRFGRDAASLRLAAAAAGIPSPDGYDVVHCHFGPSGILGEKLRSAGVLRGRLVTTFYGYDVSGFVRRRGARCYRRLFARGDLFLALSETMRTRLIELGCPRQRTRVHHLGVRCREFPFRPRQRDEGQPLRLISVARLAEKKGLEYAIRAVARLTALGLDVQLEIIGDGPLRHSLEDLVKDLDLEPQVSLLGWKAQPEVRRHLLEAHILLAPSVTAASGDQEGTPTVLLEAMATGLPIVATRHGGISEQVTDGVHGYLVAERDVDALTASLERLASRPQLCAEMGRHGRQRVEEAFDSDTLNERLVALYRELLDRGGAAAGPASGLVPPSTRGSGPSP